MSTFRWWRPVPQSHSSPAVARYYARVWDHRFRRRSHGRVGLDCGASLRIVVKRPVDGPWAAPILMHHTIAFEAQFKPLPRAKL
jgi:hypothetical protein